MGLPGINAATAKPMPMTMGVESEANIKGSSTVDAGLMGMKKVTAGEGGITAEAINKMRAQLLKFACDEYGVKGFDALPQSVRDALDAGTGEGQKSVPLKERVVNVLDTVKWGLFTELREGIRDLAAGSHSVDFYFKADRQKIDASITGLDGEKNFMAASEEAMAVLSGGTKSKAAILRSLAAYSNQLEIAKGVIVGNTIGVNEFGLDMCPEFKVANEVQAKIQKVIEGIRNGAYDNEKPVEEAKEPPKMNAEQERKLKYQELSNVIDSLPGKLPEMEQEEHLQLSTLISNLTDALDGGRVPASNDINKFVKFLDSQKQREEMKKPNKMPLLKLINNVQDALNALGND